MVAAEVAQAQGRRPAHQHFRRAGSVLAEAAGFHEIDRAVAAAHRPHRLPHGAAPLGIAAGQHHAGEVLRFAPERRAPPVGAAPHEATQRGAQVVADDVEVGLGREPSAEPRQQAGRADRLQQQGDERHQRERDQHLDQ